MRGRVCGCDTRRIDFELAQAKVVSVLLLVDQRQILDRRRVGNRPHGHPLQTLGDLSSARFKSPARSMGDKRHAYNHPRIAAINVVSTETFQARTARGKIAAQTLTATAATPEAMSP